MRTPLVLLFSCLLLTSACHQVQEPVTGKTRHVVTSKEQEIELGEQAYQQALTQYQVVHDEAWTQLLDQVGQRIAHATDHPEYHWQFTIIKDAQLNAVALPSGQILVTSGMMCFAQNTAQLATVLGHEAAHVTARHAGQKITAQYGVRLGLGLINAVLVGRDMPGRQAIMQLLGVGTQLGAMLPYSRQMESEADTIGMIYMAEAGYEPDAALHLWEHMQAATRGQSPPAFLSDHPSPGDRLASLKGELAAAQQAYAKSPRYGTGVPMSEQCQIAH